ncbi:hypothetical protein SAMN05518847_11021 [Paenibacillus sp. OV219]|nr:hypothetical protein SAMN05518847_11021 [Paenibacillus sp. OV219]
MFGGDLPVLHLTVSRYSNRLGDWSDKRSVECSIATLDAHAATEAVMCVMVQSRRKVLLLLCCSRMKELFSHLHTGCALSLLLSFYLYELIHYSNLTLGRTEPAIRRPCAAMHSNRGIRLMRG